MVNPALPPSRFGAGYTSGSPAASHAVAPPVLPAQAPRGGGTPGPIPNAPAIAGSPQVVNRLAIIAFALSVAFGSVLFWLTIPMAALADSRIRRFQQDGAGLARAALVISCIYGALVIVVVALAVYLSSSAAAAGIGIV